jgi:hypothetical protein
VNLLKREAARGIIGGNRGRIIGSKRIGIRQYQAEADAE